jgi:hypothetical protein
MCKVWGFREAINAASDPALHSTILAFHNLS